MPKKLEQALTRAVIWFEKQLVVEYSVSVQLAALAVGFIILAAIYALRSRIIGMFVPVAAFWLRQV